MKIHTPHITMLNQALSEHRQLTLGEQFMAKALLDAVREKALKFYEQPAPIARIEKTDDSETRALKRRGLLEVSKFLYECDDIPDDLRALLLDLLPEALNDYAVNAGHRRAKPVSRPSKAGSTAANVAANAATNATLDALIQRQGAFETRMMENFGEMQSALLAALRPPATAPALPAEMSDTAALAAKKEE